MAPTKPVRILVPRKGRFSFGGARETALLVRMWLAPYTARLPRIRSLKPSKASQAPNGGKQALKKEEKKREN